MSVDPLIRFFETLSPQTLPRIGDFYAADARFKDPFNDVQGTAAIGKIFNHMFTQVDAPRFVIGERVIGAHDAVLIWEFRFGMRLWGRSRAQVIRGASHLKFGTDGKVVLHRDYWDTSEELYMKLPMLGLLMRTLRRWLAA